MRTILGLLASAALVSVAAAAEPGRLPGRLPEGAVPIHYAIRIVPDAQALSFTGQETVSILLKAPARRIVLNAADLEITEASVDGRAAQVRLDAEAETLSLNFAKALPAGLHTLQIDYRGRIRQSATGLFALDYAAEGGTKQQRILTTQFQPGDARRFAPMWDEPARKATFQLAVEIPQGQSAFANMPVKSDEPGGAGKHLVTFASTPKMSSYLLHVSIGELERISQTVQGVDVGIVTRKGAKEQGVFALQSAVEVLRYYNDYFGTPYPLPKLDLIAVPGSSQFFGAMENWGAILFFEQFLLLDPERSSENDRRNVFEYVGHEIAHQWFGNLVTMAWWNDLWLNEGFANWMELKARSVLHPEWQAWEMLVLGDRENAMRNDARSSTHALVQAVPSVRAANQAFDAIAYAKGVSIVRMIETLAGADAFREGLRRYMKRHAYGNAVTEDLWSAIEGASAQPVRAVARDFSAQPGLPLISVETGAVCKRGRTAVTLKATRFEVGTKSGKSLRWRVPVRLQQLGPGGSQRTVIVNGGATAELLLDGCGTVIANAGATGYFRTAYGPHAAAALAEDFSRLAQIDQLVLLTDAWSLGENGTQPAGAWMALAASVPADAQALTLLTVAAVLRRVDWLYQGLLPEQALLRAFTRARLHPALERIGWTRKAGEAENAAVLREFLIPVLGISDDTEVIAEARRRWRRAADESEALPPAIREAVLAVVSRHADAATWEQTAARAASATAPTEKRKLYEALGGAADPALARRALDLALAGEAGPTSGPWIMRAVAWIHPDLAFRFGLEHEAQIAAMVEGASRWSFIPKLAATSADPATASALKAYMAQKVPADSRAEAASALAAIEARIRAKADRLPEITAWLKSRAASGP